MKARFAIALIAIAMLCASAQRRRTQLRLVSKSQELMKTIPMKRPPGLR